MDNDGISKVVLTFDRARLANGQQIAIKSTIVGVYADGTDAGRFNPSLFDSGIEGTLGAFE